MSERTMMNWQHHDDVTQQSFRNDLLLHKWDLEIDRLYLLPILKLFSMKAGNLVRQLGDKLIGNGEYLFGEKKDLVDLLSNGQVWRASPSFVSESDSALSRLDWFQETRLPWSSHPNLAILTLHDQIVSDQSGSQLLSYIYCNGNSGVDFLVFTVATVRIKIPNLAT